ncbi:RNA-binding cell elongation regulator Jag/EloR [[Clostridium] colinum]|uniref:RNA-binding cell elongation regulator Jag/EloR n=1 Tax=[Clostridium] colinum TaxID=36835 RepID=UPI0020251000|nr:RNA-binding cell elongation regulator Jag/EloR [[Clostridium] colinum]
MEVQKIAKTVNLAIDEALKDLNTTIDKIDYTVLQEPSKGFLGIGSKPAKVLVKLKNEINSIDSKYEELNKFIEKNENYNNSQDETRVEMRIPRIVSEDSFDEPMEPMKDPIKQEKTKELNKNAPIIATNFLKEVFDTMKIEVEVSAEINEKNNLIIDLKGNDIGVIIGKRGQTLDSLQYLTNLVVNKGEFSYMSVSIDIADYRERRKQTLEQLAINLAKKAKKTRKSINLEPMNPYERRIIHNALQNDTSVTTYSEGDEPFRYIVIAPK